MIKSIPSHGLKNGNIAIEASKIEMMRLIGDIAKISRIRYEKKKWYSTIRKVAWIRLVIEYTSYFLFSENSFRTWLCLFLLLTVSRNAVTNVVILNTELDILDRIQAKFPKNSLNRLVPVENT